MPRYKLSIEYDGTGLCGWQRQHGQMSVQELLEGALEKFCGAKVETVAAGRTDSGVHALAQIVHVDLPKEYPDYNVQQGINFYLLPETRVIALAAQKVSDAFHARFQAIGRSYLYRIVNRPIRLAIERDRAWHVPEPLDAALMHQAAQTLLGHHDFTTFRDSKCQATTAMKTLERLDVSHIGDEICIITEARSFLHHQVRNMAGTLRLVGNGKWSLDDFGKAFAAKDRRAGGETAEPQGLYLTAVKYPASAA